MEEIRWADVFGWYKAAIFESFSEDFSVFTLNYLNAETAVDERLLEMAKSLDKPIEIIVIERK